jgi:hypothetical protein
MRIVPLTLAEANRLVEQWHRHHTPVRGHRFSIGVEHEGKIVGAAICGRPVARMLDHRKVLEVTRLVTDGTTNACSKLLGACARIAKEMGFERIQTYTLKEESGVSLRASGWMRESETAGGCWSRRSRERESRESIQGQKVRWVAP